MRRYIRNKCCFCTRSKAICNKFIQVPDFYYNLLTVNIRVDLHSNDIFKKNTHCSLADSIF